MKKHSSSEALVSKKAPESENDIYADLKADHKEIKALCTKIRSNREGDALHVVRDFSALKALVTAHARTEERVFYETLMQYTEGAEAHDDDLKHFLFEAYEEHHVADQLIQEISSLDPSDPRWMAKVSVLSEVLNHHIEEEESDLFKKAKKELVDAEAYTLAREFEDGKREMMEAN